MNRFQTCLRTVLLYEGGFSNHPEDPGGATKYGITKKVFEEWAECSVTVEDIKNLTIADVEPIYFNKYWERMRCGEMPIGVDLMVFDFGVNAGPMRSIRFLQEVVHAHQDGIIGTETLGLVNEFHNPVIIVTNLSQKRKSYYKSLRTYATFGRGWDRRTEGVTTAALAAIQDDE